MTDRLDWFITSLWKCCPKRRDIIDKTGNSSICS